MTAEPSTGRGLLDHAYKLLEDGREDLVDTAGEPGGEGTATADRWTEIGDWLSLGHRMRAEKVLFLRNEPIFVFNHLVSDDEALLREVYARAWSMSGPFCMFVALPTELRVYALTAPPPDFRTEERLTPLKVLRRVEQVDAMLGWGASPEDPEGPLHLLQRERSRRRSDAQLIGDLGAIRRRLVAPGVGLRVEQAHSLLGRSILIRYLEDRRVLTREYFEAVAAEDPLWSELLDRDDAAPDLAPGRRHRFYDRVLRDVGFTTALYRRLATDFNGDLFSLGADALDDLPIDRLEAALGLLRRLLLGDVDEGQPRLFVWAYDFEVVPISLISSIYEEFHHGARRGPVPTPDDGTDVGPRPAGASARKVDDNTHYTPWTLVHDVLSRVLTDEVLARDPRVLDPACGSGIFLVEAFRRIVRSKARRLGRSLTTVELRRTLRDQIAGIEVDGGAARVAAFSLHLALLDQQTPPDILASGRLPHLLAGDVEDEGHLGIIVVGNAFDLTAGERDDLLGRLAAPRFAGRAATRRLIASPVDLPFERGAFDVVIGNPPWQEIAEGAVEPKSAEHGRKALAWADAFSHTVGGKSYSQLFLLRSLSFLSPTGRSGLLVGTKALWNAHARSRLFRREFLGAARVEEVINYTQVRRVFFAKAVAPFTFVHFGRRAPGEPDGMVVYWSARRTAALGALRSMALARVDRRVVRQADLRDRDYLWKTYWWGNHHDAALVARLERETTLGDHLAGRSPTPGYGWQRGARPPGPSITGRPVLGSDAVEPFGPLQADWFEPSPEGVGRDPEPRRYDGRRLVVTRGVKEPHGPVVRLEHDAFSFRHTILGVPLPGIPDRDAKAILGFAWSSLARYRLFMTSGGWGGAGTTR